MPNYYKRDLYDINTTNIQIFTDRVDELIKEKFGRTQNLVIEYIEEVKEEAIQKRVKEIDNFIEEYNNDDTHYTKYRRSEESRQKLIDNLSENCIGYMLFCSYNGMLVSATEAIYQYGMLMEKEKEEWDSLPLVKKLLYNFENREKAPTLKEGYITLAIIIFFEMFFTFRFELITATLGIFWMWRKKQLDIFNGRADKWRTKKK